MKATEAHFREYNPAGFSLLVAYRRNALRDSSLSPGVEFFSFLRNLTADGFFTSKIGIEYLRYIGNTAIREFPGCLPVPES